MQEQEDSMMPVQSGALYRAQASGSNRQSKKVQDWSGAVCNGFGIWECYVSDPESKGSVFGGVTYDFGWSMANTGRWYACHSGSIHSCAGGISGRKSGYILLTNVFLLLPEIMCSQHL